MRLPSVLFSVQGLLMIFITPHALNKFDVMAMQAIKSRRFIGGSGWFVGGDYVVLGEIVPNLNH